MSLPHEQPVVDFDCFNLSDTFHNTRKTAAELAVIICSHVSIDDYMAPPDWDFTPQFRSTVGTGGSGWGWSNASQGHQRSVLASHFASYAQQQYQSCYIGQVDYECLNALLIWLKEDYNPPQHRHHIVDHEIALLSDVCREFRRQYAIKVPEFLFEFIKQ